MVFLRLFSHFQPTKPGKKMVQGCDGDLSDM